MAAEITMTQRRPTDGWFYHFSWRPRFTLRAMLGVTALLCVMMWIHLHWIHQRRAAIASGQVTAVPILDSAGALAHPP